MQWKEGPAVTATMTWVGLDVHARSTHAAAIVHEEGFAVNHRKTRVMRQGVRQEL